MEEENIKTEQHTSSEKSFVTLVEKGLPHKNKQSSLNSNIFPIIPVDLREIPRPAGFDSSAATAAEITVTQRRRADCHAVDTFVTVPR